MRLIIIRNVNNKHSKLIKGKEIKEKMKKIILIILTLSFFKSMTLANEVNVFSARHYDSDIQLYNKFTSQTGIKVNVISGKDKSLQKRIIEEGKDSKADLYITADARSEEHTYELQSRSELVCSLLLEKKKYQPYYAGRYH